jgi:leader peptidase (prepilin peptidase)/N-methyltransferase
MSGFETLHHAFLANPILFNVVVFIVSLMVGSFLNVVIYRLPVMMQNEWQQDCAEFLGKPVKESPTRFDLIKPDSHCPKCKNKLKPWHNIPVVSYLFLRGKCAFCQTSVSVRYPIIELATALLSTLIAVKFGYTLQSGILIVLTWVFICLVMIDFDHMLLPDQLTFPLLWLILFVSQWQVFMSPIDTINGAIVGYLCLWSVYWLFKLLTGKEGMGHGDFKLLAVVGALVGVWKLPMVVLMSSLVALVIIGSRIVLKKHSADKPAPFGPYIAIAGWTTIMWGEPLFHWYVGVISG